jgi:uncharacterized oxidoreductase
LREVGYELFQAAGCRDADARAVVDHLVESSLFGHDSHGAIRFYEYVRSVREGRFNPAASPEIVQEHPCAAVVDGGGAMGQVGATFATNLAMKKASEHGVATVTLRNTSHVGRAGAYPLKAAREGMLGLIFVNAGREGYKVAPFGAIEGRLSTDPIGFAAPRREADPILVDMTTSVVADGKIRVAINQEKSIPEGWGIDSEGNPTTDPKRVRMDPMGALLPLGGVVAYKGTALTLIVEILGGALSGEGCASPAQEMVSNGVCLTAYHIEHFREIGAFYDELEDLIAHMKSARTAPGVDEILLPGEPEFRCARQRGRDGIEVDETTWEAICGEARKHGVDTENWAEKALRIEN